MTVTLYANARLLDPATDYDGPGGVIVDNGVIAEVLHARFAIPGALFGGLVLYTTLNTMLPSLLLHQPFDIDPLDAGEPWRHPEDVSPSGSTPPSSPPGLS